LALLERYIDRPAATKKSSTVFVLAIIAALALLAVGGIVLAVVVVRWLIGALG
jgi:hypothetical protein